MSISDRLDEIQTRADKALTGPWEVNPFAHSVRKVGTSKVVCQISVLDNAAFIAHARTDVPALVAALRAVLHLHAETYYDGRICTECVYLEGDELEPEPYPCRTVRAIEDALGRGLDQ